MSVKHVLILPDTVLSDVRDIEECGQFLALNVIQDGDNVSVGFVNKPGDVEKTYTKTEAAELFKLLLSADLGSDFDKIKSHIRVCEFGDYSRKNTQGLLQKYYPDIYKVMRGFKKQKKAMSRARQTIKRVSPKIYKEMIEKEKAKKEELEKAEKKKKTQSKSKTTS